jgi:hypothetical protein
MDPGERHVARGHVAVIVLVFSAITMTACGGSDTGSPSVGVGEEFAARATAVCDTALKSKQAWSTFPVASFDPTHPDKMALPEVAGWLEQEVTPTFDAWFAGLQALGDPPSGQQAWNDVLAAVGTIDELNADQVATAKADDTAGFARATQGLHDIQAELERATQAADVASCATVHASG